MEDDERKIIYHNFRNPPEESHQEKMTRFESKFCEMTSSIEALIASELEKPIEDQNTDDLNRWKDKLDRIRGWSANLSTLSAKTIQALIDSIEDKAE